MSRAVPPTRPCVRCGRRCTLGGNTQPLVLCRDCRAADPEYVRLIGAAS